MKAKIFCFLILSWVLVQPLWADPVFDFESVTPGYYSGSLVVTNDGVTLTVTAEGYPSGWLYVSTVGGISNQSPFGQSVIGSIANPLNVNQFAPMRFAFSHLISSITFAFGDSGGDDDSPWFIRAYNSSAVPLTTVSGNYAAGDGSGLTQLVNLGSTPASHFILSSTPTFNPHSMFWEVQSATLADSNSVPEPSTLFLLSGGLGFVALFRKRFA